MAVEITIAETTEVGRMLLVHPVGDNFDNVTETVAAIRSFLTDKGLDVWTDEKHGSIEIWIEKG